MGTTAIKGRPILFSGPMVNAILEGRKTQTRRVVKPQPERVQIQGGDWLCDDGRILKCPYGMFGERLWVRETWEPLEFNDHEVGVCYAATPTEGVRQKNSVRWCHVGEEEALKWQHRSGKQFPSIHMPRWASRITLEITDVRVERLNEISEADALAEGCIRLPASGRITNVAGGQYGGLVWSTPELWYRDLWNDINGPDSWSTNPWVWAITFKRVEG